MSAKIWALVMTALAAIYLVLLGQKAILLILDNNWVAKAMGLALLVLPIVAAWAILTEVKFGIDAERLAKTNSLPELQLELRPSGRATKESAQVEFERIKALVSQDLENWELWFRLGECYDASGDRKLARKSIRKAIKLANNSKSL
ncbi:MAG: tetratricopeptide repeat protein [Actinomycetota bacterium]|nr:tetratricopeptide repeat protein [Actinomycetota bacterium]